MSHKAITSLNSDRNTEVAVSPVPCNAELISSSGIGSTLCSGSKQSEHGKPYLPFSIAYNESMFVHQPAIKANKQNQEFQAMPCFPFQFT